MNEYTVLIAFEQYAKSDILRMSSRQAQYLLMDGKVKLVVKKPQVKGKK